MRRCIVPETVIAELARLDQGAQLCDASGRSIGYFLPAVDPAKYEVLGPEPTEEELRRAEQSSQWHTTAEVLRHLENLR